MPEETLAAILAEMRNFCSGWPEDLDVTVKVGLIYGWMCRLKEAAEREKQPGNAAALRETLEKIRREYCDGLISCQTCVSSDADVERVSRLFYEEIDAALAAPARNCDRFRTPKDALDAFIREKGITSADVDSMNLRDFFDWLFEKAEGTEATP